MKILAIETSCDDTSIAIFEDDRLLAIQTKSQIKIHQITGGVVPEIAAREHANSIFEVLENVLKSSNIYLEELDYIAVTSYPGLIPSLLTGLTVAKTLGKILSKPVLELNHIEGHIFSNFLERKKEDIKFPLVCLTVSGGHNDIYFMQSMWNIHKMGSSNDDSAGECYDKVAKMMGLEYPGGPIVSKLAGEYNLIKGVNILPLFPRVWLDKKKFDFSFSGLKSAVKREVDKKIINNENLIKKNYGDLIELKELYKNGQILLTKKEKIEISFEFQNAINEVLAYKLVFGAKEKGVKDIMLAGGVSANDDLKNKIKILATENDLNFMYPIKNLYCMDNAAMIGILAYYKINFSN